MDARTSQINTGFLKIFSTHPTLSGHLSLVNAGDGEIVSKDVGEEERDT